MAVKTQAQLLAQVASLLADNTTGDISALDVRTCLNDIIDSANYGGSKVYKALLSQSGTSAPTIESNGTGANTPLVNTLSGTPTFGYTAAGDYTFNLTGEFTSGKVLILMGSVDNPTSVITYNRVSDDTIIIKTKIAGVGTNDLLSNISFYVEVYP